MRDARPEAGDAPGVRLARDRGDLDACVALQRAVWGVSDLEITGPVQLAATSHAGGVLLLAEEPPGAVVGFAYAFPGLRDGEPHLHSDMLAVHPDSRGRGIGRRLKWAQRDEALRRGIRLVTWTFDPLQARNARLNLRHLGATAGELLPDLYGAAAHGPRHDRPTHRLGVRWELTSPSVKQRAGRKAPPPAAALLDAPLINDVVLDAGLPVSGSPRRDLEAPTVLLEIPADWEALCRDAPTAAARWQDQVRGSFEAYFARGYRAVDLVTVMETGRACPRYVLHRFPTAPGA
jgi:chorismate synthase